MIVPDEARVVLISGANRGIGLAIARELANGGWRLSLGARNPAGFAEERTTGFDPARTLFFAYEASDPQSAARWVAATVEHFGRLDAVVANAAEFHPCGVEEGTDVVLERLWQVNAKGPWHLVRAALEPLKRCGRGRVVFISSLAGKRVRTEDYTGYAMSKFALMALAQGLRLHGWEHGIRVAAVCPGIVATDMTAGSALPRHEMTQPETVAATVSWLLELPNDTYVPEIGLANILETGWA